jgi:hypothetical protein
MNNNNDDNNINDITELTTHFLSKYNIYNTHQSRNNRETQRETQDNLKLHSKMSYKDIRFYKKRLSQVYKSLYYYYLYSYKNQHKSTQNNQDTNGNINSLENSPDISDDMMEVFEKFLFLSINHFKFIDKTTILQEEYNNIIKNTDENINRNIDGNIDNKSKPIPDIDKTFFLDKDKINIDNANNILMKNVNISLRGKPINTLMNIKKTPLYQKKPIFIPKQKKINIKEKRFKYKDKKDKDAKKDKKKNNENINNIDNKIDNK